MNPLQQKAEDIRGSITDAMIRVLDKLGSDDHGRASPQEAERISKAIASTGIEVIYGIDAQGPGGRPQLYTKVRLKASGEQIAFWWGIP